MNHYRCCNHCDPYRDADGVCEGAGDGPNSHVEPCGTPGCEGNAVMQEES